MYLRLLAVSCAVLLLFTAVVQSEKSLETCEIKLPANKKCPDIVYFRTSRGGSSPPRMHYAWSMAGFPTLFMSRSNESVPNCRDSISYTPSEFVQSQKFGSVNISGTDGAFNFALVFSRVILFMSGDKAKEAFDPQKTFNKDTHGKYRSFWLNEAFERNVSYSHRTFNLKRPWNWSEPNSITGLDIKVGIPTHQGESRLSDFPHTLFTEDSSTFDLTISFHFSSSWMKKNKTRVALELMLIYGHGMYDGKVRTTTSVDDEYTPSVFKTLTYEFGNASNKEGYVVWKPISYQTSERVSTSSQQANVVYPNGEATIIDELPRGLATALFGDLDNIGNATRLYMVFGTSGDDTFLNPTYMTWTAAVGYGKSPSEHISLAVIITISLGLGIPGLLVIAGGLFVIIRKKPWENVKRTSGRNRKGYTPMN